jgi:hypothetical protein
VEDVMRLSSPRLAFVALAVACVGLPTGVARGQIFVSDWLSGMIGEWTTSGSSTNASLITGLSAPYGIATSGGYLYVANEQANTIGKYTMAGQVVDASFITGLSAPTQLIASGTNLYVMNTSSTTSAFTIGKYTTAGQTVSSAFITLTNCFPYSMALSGTSLFVVGVSFPSQSHSPNSFVVEYSAANGSFLGDVIPEVPGSATGFYGLAASATSLYLSFYYTNGFISEYTTSGSLVNAKLIDNLESPQNLVLSGTDLYVLEIGPNRIGQYTTSGQTVNAALVTGLSNPRNLAVVPEPSTYVMALAGLACGGYLVKRRRKRA